MRRLDFTVWSEWRCFAVLAALKARPGASVFFLALKERLEVCLRGRQGFRCHGLSLHVFLQRFVFFCV